MDPSQLAADFLLEYPRRFLWLLLTAWDADRQGHTVHLDMRETLRPWPEWSRDHGPELDALVEPLTDAQVKVLLDELTGFLAYALLSHGSAQGGPALVSALAAGLPARSPLGPIDLRGILDAYGRTSSVTDTLADRLSASLTGSRDPRGLLITLGTGMAQVAEGVAKVLTQG